MDVNIGTIEENAVFPPVGARHLYETLKTVYSVCSKNTKTECLLLFQPIMIYKLKLLFNFVYLVPSVTVCARAGSQSIIWHIFTCSESIAEVCPRYKDLVSYSLHIWNIYFKAIIFSTLWSRSGFMALFWTQPIYLRRADVKHQQPQSVCISFKMFVTFLTEYYLILIIQTRLFTISCEKVFLAGEVLFSSPCVED